MHHAGGPAPIKRVQFLHGNNFHDGGWFDAAKGKPRVQIRRDKDTAWETVGELADYPNTTSTDPAGLRSGQSFVLKLTHAVSVRAVRVLGVPAGGDFPNQNFSSCTELRALSE